MPTGPLARFRLAYDFSELFRRYFINTLFDSTFVVLGIVSATVVTTDTPIGVTLGAMAAACIAIGISTGVSVYEAERLEADIRMAKIERAMLSEMKDTHLDQSLQLYRALVSLVNLSAPIIVFAVTATPFFFHLGLGTPSLAEASKLSIFLAIALVFIAGYALGRVAERSAIQQGLRMSIAAIGTFLLLILIQVYFL